MSQRAIFSRVTALTAVLVGTQCSARAVHRAASPPEPASSRPRAADDIRRRPFDGGDPDVRHDRDQRGEWWKQAKFGMFIHWGMYTVLGGSWQGRQIGGDGAWIM